MRIPTSLSIALVATGCAVLFSGAIKEFTCASVVRNRGKPRSKVKVPTERPPLRTCVNILLMSLAACAGLDAGGNGVDVPPAGPTTMTDYQVAELRPTGRFDLVPDLVIADEAPESFFERIADIDVDDTGDIYVLDSGRSRVQVYSPEGVLLRSFGREGAGPGELRRPSALAVTDSRVFVNDMGNRRTVIWSLDGRVVDHVRSGGLGRSEKMMGTATENVIALTRDRSADGTRLLRVASFDKDFEERDLFGQFEVVAGIVPRSAEARQSAFVEGLLLSANEATQPAATFEAARDGSIYISERARYVIDAFGLDGEHRWRVRVHVEPEMFPDAAAEEIVAIARNRVPGIGRSSIAWPEYLPAIRKLEVDGAGKLYVFPYVYGFEEADGRDHPVQVFSVNGDLLLSGVIPDRDWLAAHRDYIYTREADPSTGDPQVVRWKLVFPAGQ